MYPIINSMQQGCILKVDEDRDARVAAIRCKEF
jgi:hypothetical protein